MNIVFKSKFMNELTNEKKLIIDTEIIINPVMEDQFISNHHYKKL